MPYHDWKLLAHLQHWSHTYTVPRLCQHHAGRYQAISRHRQYPLQNIDRIIFNIALAMDHWNLFLVIWWYHFNRGHFVYAPTQWEVTLQCNIVSHWLGAYTEWSLFQWPGRSREICAPFQYFPSSPRGSGEPLVTGRCTLFCHSSALCAAVTRDELTNEQIPGVAESNDFAGWFLFVEAPCDKLSVTQLRPVVFATV